MRQIMGNVGKQPGLLSRLPGFNQLNQLKNIQGLDMEEMLGREMAQAMDPSAMAMGARRWAPTGARVCAVG